MRAQRRLGGSVGSDLGSTGTCRPRYRQDLRSRTRATRRLVRAAPRRGCRAVRRQRRGQVDVHQVPLRGRSHPTRGISRSQDGRVETAVDPRRRGARDHDRPPGPRAGPRPDRAGEHVPRPGDRCVPGLAWQARDHLARRWRAQSAAALAALQIKLPSVRVQVTALSGGQKQAVAVARASMWSTDRDPDGRADGRARYAPERRRLRADPPHRRRGLGVMVISHDILASSRSPTGSSSCGTGGRAGATYASESPGATSSTRWSATTRRRREAPVIEPSADQLPDDPADVMAAGGPVVPHARRPSASSTALGRTALWIFAIDIILVIVFGLLSPHHTFWSVAGLQVIATRCHRPR